LENERNDKSRLGAIIRSAYSNPSTPNTRQRGKFWSEGWGVLADVWTAMVVGFASTAHQFGQVYACTRPGEEQLMLISSMDDILLDTGETRESEWGYLQFVPLPNPEPASDFFKAVSRQMRARIPAVPPPPMWTHWYHYYHDITEDLFLQNLDELAGQRQKVPFQVVELDDGYQSAWGDWTTTNDKFPHGLEWLAEQIIAKGFTPGLWLAPFVVHPKSKVALQHPDRLVKSKNGKAQNAAFVYNQFLNALDLTHPAVIEHLRSLTSTLTQQWGYRMLKVDFINAAALPGKRHDPKLTRAEALRLGLETIRQAAGEQTFLLASGCPFGPAIGLVDAMRIGPDTAPNWKPYFHWVTWAGPLIKEEPSMPSLRNALRHTMNLSSLHKRWWWNDPDCLLVRDTDTRLTWHEIQSAVTLVGLSGGMLVLSDGLRKLNASRLRWISLLVPNLGLRGVPLDWLEHEMPHLYQMQLPKTEKNWHSVAVFNWSDLPEDYCLWFNKLGYKPGAVLHVFDFWSGRYHQVTDPQIIFPALPTHGCKLLRICEVAETPQLVGDTLHISQGAEIAAWKVEGPLLSIETVDMNRRVEGELWLALARMPVGVTCNGEQVEVKDKGEGMFTLHLEFSDKARVEVSL
jgi:alpha-galactosidase